MLPTSALLLLLATAALVAAQQPVANSPAKLWAATDVFNASASTQVVVVQNVAVVGTRGPQLIGKRVDRHSNEPPFPVLSDWNITLDATPTFLAAISDNHVAVVTNDTVGAYAFDGTPLWNYSLNASFTFSSNGQTSVTMLVDLVRGLGFIGTQPNSDDVVPAPVVAINLTSGVSLWEQYDTYANTNNHFALSRNALYVPYTNSEFNGLMRIHALTGKVMWVRNFTSPSYFAVVAGPEYVVATLDEGTIAILDAQSGAPWSGKVPTIKGGSAVRHSPMVRNGTLFLLSGSYLSAVDVTKWTVTFDHAMKDSIDAMFLDDLTSSVFVCTYGALDVVDVRTGKPQYVLPARDGDDASCKGILRVSPRAVVVSYNNIYLVDVPTKTMMWSFDMGAISAPVFVPTIFDGLIVSANSFGVPGWPIEALQAVSVLPTSRFWNFLTDFLMIHPQIDNTTMDVTFGMDTDRFYAWHISDGRPNWTMTERLTVFHPLPGLQVTTSALCAATSFHLYCVGKYDGKLWSKTTFGAHNMIPMHVMQWRYVLMANTDAAGVIDTTLPGSGLVQQVSVNQFDVGDIAHVDPIDDQHFAIMIDGGGASGVMFYCRLEWNNQSTPLWNASVPNTNYACPPVLVGSTIVIGDGQNNLYGYDRTTGKQLWKQSQAASICTNVVLASKGGVIDDTVFFLVTLSTAYKVSTATGAFLWTSETVNDEFSSRALLADAFDTIVVHSASAVYGFNATTGATRWVFGPSQHSISGQAQIYGSAYVMVRGSEIAGFSIATGEKLFTVDEQFSTGGFVMSAPPATGNNGQLQRGPVAIFGSCQPDKINVIYGISLPPSLFE